MTNNYILKRYLTNCSKVTNNNASHYQAGFNDYNIKQFCKYNLLVVFQTCTSFYIFLSCIILGCEIHAVLVQIIIEKKNKQKTLYINSC